MAREVPTRERSGMGMCRVPPFPLIKTYATMFRRCQVKTSVLPCGYVGFAANSFSWVWGEGSAGAGSGEQGETIHNLRVNHTIKRGI
jgi:hypothetical protein